MSLDVYLKELRPVEVYTDDITHNLSKMAMEAGIYHCLWHPENCGIKIASDAIRPLEDGIRKLKENRELLLEFNPTNGWGDYDALLSFAERYLAACRENPGATVEVSR